MESRVSVFINNGIKTSIFNLFIIISVKIKALIEYISAIIFSFFNLGFIIFYKENVFSFFKDKIDQIII